MAKSRTSGQGRPRGLPNKLNADIKTMIVDALHAAGGQAYLARQAETNPAAFMALLGRVLPLQMAGDEGGALVIEVVTGVPRGDAACVVDGNMTVSNRAAIAASDVVTASRYQVIG
jgi:hypothetical protein